MPVAEGNPQTLYDKVLQAHIVDEKLDGTILLYIGAFVTRVSSAAHHNLCFGLSIDLCFFYSFLFF
jgi:hypothetical protein